MSFHKSFSLYLQQWQGSMLYYFYFLRYKSPQLSSISFIQTHSLMSLLALIQMCEEFWEKSRLPWGRADQLVNWSKIKWSALKTRILVTLDRLRRVHLGICIGVYYQYCYCSFVT